MRRLALVVMVLFLVVEPIFAQEQIIFQMRDPGRDDRGAGGVLYPSHQVFVPGLFDLRKFTVLRDADNYYFDLTFTTVTNPFGAPEGYFHQRIEIYLDTSFPGGREDISFGQYKLQTSPEYGWEIRLSVAPFNESYLQLLTSQGTKKVTAGITSYLKLDGETIRVQVDQNLLPEQPKLWHYYVLVGAFDGLAPEFWRDVGVDPWALGGEKPPVFDLLAPKWGLRSQKSQLRRCTLHPVGTAWFGSLPWLVIILVAALLLGLVFWFVFLGRWFRARN